MGKHTHPYTYTLANLPNVAAEQQQIKTFIIHKIPSGMKGEEEKTVYYHLRDIYWFLTLWGFFMAGNH